MDTVTADVLAPDETLVSIHPTTDGNADVDLWWTAGGVLCEEHLHTHPTALVRSFEQAGVHFRGVDDETEELLAAIHREVGW